MSIFPSLRTVLRWAATIAAVLVLALTGLIVADALHKRGCHGSHKGEVIQVRGERIAFLNTGKETNGEVLEMDILYKPSAEDNESHWRDVHVHRDQEEGFEVISGTARFQVAGREQTVAAGQRISVPRSVPHSFASSTGEELRLRAESFGLRFVPTPLLRTSCAHAKHAERFRCFKPLSSSGNLRVSRTLPACGAMVCRLCSRCSLRLDVPQAIRLVDLKKEQYHVNRWFDLL